MGDLIFNPAAKPGDVRMAHLYVSSGDGGSGEANTSTGPNGLSFELLEFGPDSLQREVINGWK